jgi:hypothetical protein
MCSPASRVSTAKAASFGVSPVTRSNHCSSARRASGMSPRSVHAVISGSFIHASAFSKCFARSSGTSRVFSPSHP